MLKFALDHHPRLRHTFIYSNKTWDDVIYKQALVDLSAKHPGRLAVVHTLTREPDESVYGHSVRKGRISAALLRELIPSPTECVAYVCGPGISKWDVEAAKETGGKPQPRFLESVLTGLEEIGMPPKRIKREFYG
jgi:ferredoxin-NADP reductase